MPSNDAGTLTVKTKIEGGTKPGYKTTEFWGTLIAHLVALLMIAYGTWKANDSLIQFGGVLMALSQGSYNLARSNEKGAALKSLGAALAEGKETA